jgi:hypothetical protein
MEPGDSRYPGGVGGPGTQRPKRDQETERTVSNKGRAKETDASENPSYAKCPEPSDVYQNYPHETEDQRARSSANPGGRRDPGARRPRRDRENESNDHPPHQEVRDSWYSQDPHVADNVRWKESAYISFLIKSESSSAPKGLYEKPDTVLKSEQAAHKTREVSSSSQVDFSRLVKSPPPSGFSRD